MRRSASCVMGPWSAAARDDVAQGREVMVRRRRRKHGRERDSRDAISSPLSIQDVSRGFHLLTFYSSHSSSLSLESARSKYREMRAASSLLLAPQRTAACSGLSSSARSAPSIREQSLARVRFEQRGKAWSSSPRHFSLTAARQRPNTSPSSPSSSVEYSARTGSPSGSSQKPKVEVLPFALSTQEALDFLRVPATFAALYHSRGFWRAAGYIALRWLFGYGGAAEQEVKLERCRAVFVPTWVRHNLRRPDMGGMLLTVE